MFRKSFFRIYIAFSLIGQIFLEQRILGGTEANRGDYPWQVFMELSNSKGKFQCSGTFLDGNWVLTAAHCLTGIEKENITMFFDVLDNVRDTPVFTAGAQEIFNHPDYYQELGVQFYDIALIKLDVSVPISANVKYGKLAEKNPDVGETCYVSGWGTIFSGGAASHKLLFVDVKLYSNQECQKNPKFNQGDINSHVICCGQKQGGKDACQGDSGGPLHYNNEIVGIVSWGKGCGDPDTPGVYSSVVHFRNWINYVTLNNKNSDLNGKNHKVNGNTNDDTLIIVASVAGGAFFLVILVIIIMVIYYNCIRTSQSKIEPELEYTQNGNIFVTLPISHHHHHYENENFSQP